MWSYVGHDRRGVAHTGRTPIAPAKFVESRYERGWRDLTVVAEGGQEVGAITRDLTSYQRMWWVEV